MVRDHERSGITIVGLVVFRLLWGIWGGWYARFCHYVATPRQILEHFRGAAKTAAHTAPGIALVVVLFLAVVVPVTTGLFATDDIFTEGPLTKYVSRGVAKAATAVHHRVRRHAAPGDPGAKPLAG